MNDIDEVRLTLRLPEGLRDQLLEKAKVNGRSMNAEIVSRLELTVEKEGAHGNIYELAASLETRIEALEGKVFELSEVAMGRDPYNEDD